MTTTALLSIGEVAAQTGSAPSALRYYEDVGLISTTTRVGGKRRFHPEVVGRISFVQRAQEAGFTLQEIAALLDDTAGTWRGLVDSKLDELRSRRDRIETMIQLLGEIRTCGCAVVADCPRLDHSVDSSSEH